MKVFRLFLIAGLQMNSNEDVWIFCLQQRFWMQIWFSSIFIFTFASNCGTPWQHPMFKFKEKLPEVLTSLRRRLHIPCLTKASEIYLTTLPSSLLSLLSLPSFLPYAFLGSSLALRYIVQVLWNPRLLLRVLRKKQRHRWSDWLIKEIKRHANTTKVIESLDCLMHPSI